MRMYHATQGFSTGSSHYRGSLDHVALQVQLHAVVPVDGTGAGLRMGHQLLQVLSGVR